VLNISDLKIGDKIQECEAFLGIRRKGIITNIHHDMIEYQLLDKKYCSPMYEGNSIGFVLKSEYLYWELC
jgi:hypothetical protein